MNPAILGHERVLKRLRAMVDADRLPGALLFHGPEGVGKSKVALQLAKRLNCEKGKNGPCDQTGACASCASADKQIDTDLKRVDAAYQAGLVEEEVEKQRSIKIETVRHLIKDLEMRSMAGRWKTAIVEDAHRLVEAAANALLKTLEEPPARTLWILVTHRKGELLPTILSRCHAVAFGPLPEAATAEVLRRAGVPVAEGGKLARVCEGSPGRALRLRERAGDDPAAWAKDPLAPFRLAEGLPKELHLSRPLVEDRLQALAWHLRLSRGTEGWSDPEVRRAQRELARLRAALASNADPRLVLELAALEIQRLP